MFFSETTCLVLKTVWAFEKQYLRRPFVNFWVPESFFWGSSKSWLSDQNRKKCLKINPPPFGSQKGGGWAKKQKRRFFPQKLWFVSTNVLFVRKKFFESTYNIKKRKKLKTWQNFSCGKFPFLPEFVLFWHFEPFFTCFLSYWQAKNACKPVKNSLKSTKKLYLWL